MASESWQGLPDALESDGRKERHAPQAGETPGVHNIINRLSTSLPPAIHRNRKVMCLPAAGLAAASSVVGMIGTVAGIAQAQQQANFQQQQANLQLQQQRQQTEVQNQQLANQYTGEVAAQQQQTLQYLKQRDNNLMAAQKGFNQEQTKLNEAKTKAAFKAQEIYAKSIGAKGQVLATGATGQSVGLLALDADRQAGLGLAEQDASVRSAAAQAAIGGDMQFTQAESADNQAYSQLKVPTSHPGFSPSPGGGPIDGPTYNWFE